MADTDLNLLTALDALLAEGSVAGAARRLGLSASAMSRTLARLRAATGDPLLVRAGRGLVPTPHAALLQARVGELAHEVRAVLQPAAEGLDLASLDRVFTIRANEGFVDALAGRLVAAARLAAPRVRLRFAPKPDKDVRPLREGLIDLEIGVLGASGPEVRVQALFRDYFVGVVRRGHALMAGEITPERYAACAHVVTSRRGRWDGPVDEALAALGLRRHVVAMVPGFPAALAMACTTDLVALVTHSFIRAEQERWLETAQAPVESFPLPVRTEAIRISQLWHPRLDADPAHRWLRGLLHSTCRAWHHGLEESREGD
ncbi:LysR family transcriptional regulator [Labrys okinawensis]|uniref:LysR family transcriptional regulator n=1 Tax=Labrys okinawensis TaxID=346911 RepID=UPI0039BD2276